LQGKLRGSRLADPSPCGAKVLQDLANPIGPPPKTMTPATDLSRIADARETLVSELREHALVIGRVTLTSGASAEYYVDAKRAILLPDGFQALGRLVAAEAGRAGATAVGGMTMGADPVACAALAAGAPVKAFFVRKEKKQHGLQRWVEGPLLDPGERCLIVEDVVTTGGSTVKAIERVREEGLEVAAVVSVLDRLAGGGEAIAAAAEAPYVPLTTIDDVYPDRPDR
jgi:orotate phosphoribosyltransferase